MSGVSFPEQPVPGFIVRFAHEGETCRLVCSGTLDANDSTAHLQPHLLAFHDQLLANAVREVTVDVTGVAYMNSSGVKCFMTWFIKAERSKTPPYVIQIVFDPQRTWQYVSFTTMGRIAPKVLRIQSLPAQEA